MKPEKNLPKQLAARLLTGMVMIHVLAVPATAAGKNNPGHSGEDPVIKNKVVRKKTGKKSNTVKIYPDLLKRTIHIVSKNANDGSVDFFVFGLDGVLVANHRLQPGDHVRLKDLEKGAYLYQVFDGDEMTEKGELKIK